MSDPTELSELEMVQDAAKIAWAVWRRTDFDEIDAHRNLEDEFASRIATASHCGSASQFIENLTTKWGVRSIDTGDVDVREVVHRYDEAPTSVQRRFLSTVRNNSALIVLEMKDTYQSDSDEE